MKELSIGKVWRDAGQPHEWVKKNDYVFRAIRRHKASIAGSVAMGLHLKHPKKEPGDIDVVVGTANEALALINDLVLFLTTKSVFFKVSCNANNKYTAPGSSVHFRLFCPFWKEICVMVIDDPQFCYWKGFKLQLYGDVKSRMEEIEKKSPKGRLIENYDRDGDIFDVCLGGLINQKEKEYK